MGMLELISEKEIVDIVYKLIAIEGHKDVEYKESKVAEFIKELFENEDIIVESKEIEKKRPNIYARIEGKSKDVHLMLSGHIDTIPGFDMDFEPFSPFIKDGCIFGRGSADMKGGIAAMIAAMIAIKRQELKLDKTVMFAGVIDEEERSKGTEDFIKSNGHAKYVVIGEPTSLRVCVAHKGMEWIEVTFTGKAAHGSRPKEGNNAIYMAADFIKMILEDLEPKIYARKDDLLGYGSINIGRIGGGNDPNIIPDKCFVQMDRRWLPSETLDLIHQEVEEYARIAADHFHGKYKLRGMREFTASMINAPFRIDINSELVQKALGAAASVIGQELPPRDFPAWSDAGLLTNHTDSQCIILGPGNINQAHANNEYCSIKEIIKASEIYYELIKELCI